MSSDIRGDLILASSSVSRRTMLQAAGVQFRIVPADVDEDGIRRDLVARDPDATASLVARALAKAKAEEVSRKHPAAVVIGADQVLELGRQIFTKPASLDGARASLRALAGRTHRLLSAVSLAEGGVEVWSELDEATLSMRDFSEGFLEDYIANAGERICACVGAYELEGRGVQLFDSVDGDYFTILGMPLLPLLAELRARSVIKK